MDQPKDNGPLFLSIAVVGGTGREGSGLSMRWALNGYKVVIGSRDAERASQKAAELNAQLEGDYLTGTDNETAVKNADIVVISVPYEAHQATLTQLKELLSNKIVIDVTVPLIPPNIRQVYIPEGKSAALEAQSYLGHDVRLVSAFQNVSSAKLKNLQGEIDCDVLVCSDDEAAKETVIKLVEAAGMRGIDAGPLVNASAAESLTPVLTYINKRYGVKGAGIRITGF
jgi:8-hydroxy-5-deazaflavin:NADPH oxidoreductase